MSMTQSTVRGRTQVHVARAQLMPHIVWLNALRERFAPNTCLCLQNGHWTLVASLGELVRKMQARWPCTQQQNILERTIQINRMLLR
jgi:hypothetical protein